MLRRRSVKVELSWRSILVMMRPSEGIRPDSSRHPGFPLPVLARVHPRQLLAFLVLVVFSRMG